MKRGKNGKREKGKNKKKGKREKGKKRKREKEKNRKREKEKKRKRKKRCKKEGRRETRKLLDKSSFPKREFETEQRGKRWQIFLLLTNVFEYPRILGPIYPVEQAHNNRLKSIWIYKEGEDLMKRLQVGIGNSRGAEMIISRRDKVNSFKGMLMKMLLNEFTQQIVYLNKQINPILPKSTNLIGN